MTQGQKVAPEKLSKVRTRFISAVDRMISSNTGTLPPTSPVFPPWGLTARFLSLQYLKMGTSHQTISVTTNNKYRTINQQPVITWGSERPLLSSWAVTEPRYYLHMKKGGISKPRGLTNHTVMAWFIETTELVHLSLTWASRCCRTPTRPGLWRFFPGEFGWRSWCRRMWLGRRVGESGQHCARNVAGSVQLFN